MRIRRGDATRRARTCRAAVSRALDRAGFAIVANGMLQALAHPEGGIDGVGVKEMEKLFLSLA